MNQGDPPLRFHRLLLKLSGEALQATDGGPFDPAVLDHLAREVAGLRAAGVAVGVVIGGGNIFRGLAGQTGGVDRVCGDHMGMLATVINSLALQSALARQNCPARVLSPFAWPQIAEPMSAARARTVLDAGEVALLAGGTGNPFFTTDTAAVLRALETGCQVVVKATRVDGVYDRDPARHPDARFLPRLSFEDALAHRLGVMDQTAFALCRENGLPIVVLNIRQPGILIRAARGEAVGSTVEP